jgi:long-chain fatty acid transport protein
MKQKQAVWLLCIVLISISLISSHHVFAAGLYLSQLNSPVSLGTAGVSNVVNNLAADAAYTNPAGMTGIERDTVMPGFQILIPEVKFKSSIATGGGEDGGNVGAIAPIPGFNAVKVLSDEWRLGFAITAPLGGGVEYGDNFVGRYAATRAFLSGLGLSPSLGYKINDKISVGLGVTAIYTNMDLDIAINRNALTPGPVSKPDGQVSIDKIDDWSAQGFAGLTWQVTDKAMIGFVYRTKSEIELEGDLAFKGTPLINLITGSPDKVKVDFDVVPLYGVGLAYDVSDDLRLIADFDYEEWSEFSNNYISIDTDTPSGTINTAIDRKWKDTWHVGVGVIYRMDGSAITAGVAYDSSPVEDEDRTFDLPVDEQLKIGASYSRFVRDNFGWALGLSYVWLGDGKIDQTTQGVKVQGEFETNYFVSVGGNVRYLF